MSFLVKFPPALEPTNTGKEKFSDLDQNTFSSNSGKGWGEKNTIYFVSELKLGGSMKLSSRTARAVFIFCLCFRRINFLLLLRKMALT